MKTVTLHLLNRFHGTEATVRAVPSENAPKWVFQVTKGAAARSWVRLCGYPGCTCGDALGARM